MAALAIQHIPGIIAAMGDPQYAGIRNELNHTVREMLSQNIMDSEPEAMLAWMSEIQPGEIPYAIMRWAELDMEGATTWLGEQEPSPMRDQAIAKFAREASELDAEAAASWAREIRDPELRERTLERLNRR